MLTQVTIQNYRGIRDGIFTELGPINIVVGPNNSGKSTFLEAVYLLQKTSQEADPLERDAFRVVSDRRNEGKPPEGIDLLARALGSSQQEPFLPPQTWWYRLDMTAPLRVEGTTRETDGNDELHSLLIEGPAKKPPVKISGGGPRLSRALLLDLEIVRDMRIERRLWIDLFKKRLDKPLTRWLSDVYGLQVESLSTSAEGLLVGLADVGLPIDSLGSGARVATRLLMGALVTQRSILLLEEMDAFQSSVSLKRLATYLLETCVRGDVQLFITTHRQQTIQAFLEAGEARSADVRILPLVTGKDGMVRGRGISGADAVALLESGTDLRDLYQSMRAE